ncbi:Endo-1,4-beta-xylanase [Handroanthus impetiginosus]|uniref:Endo-1,4-beta-xylanase n=1 Tax=Handroanthus impetiginosus TaxID=429701 RepID=A0A2G9GC01_9LAMI|nr:Endo-1,4-beta-xylanase [Handroanthus impetiginosus]
MAAQMPFLSLIFLIFMAGNCQAHALPYDYSFTHECLAKPLKPQYGGGIAINPELDEGLKGWTQSCDAKVEHHQESNGNNYLAASIISANQTSTIKKFHLEEDKLYTFSAWFQVSKGNAYIQAIFMTQTDNITAGWVAAQEGCWTMLKGGLVVNVTGPAELYFKSHDINSTAQIWVDNISLQPFTHQEWKSHQDQSIEKQNRPVPDATISIKQTRLNFPFGNAISGYILNNTAYQNWFASRFKYTVFENEMKWYFNEQTRGIVEYSVTEAMLQFAKSHGIAVRGHTVLWEDRLGHPTWLRDFPLNRSEEYRQLTDSRVNSVMNRYKGEVFHWDVVNENMHHWFIKERIGENSSAIYYKKAHEIDPDALLFLNEYMTLEKSSDRRASTWMYLRKIWEIREQGYEGPLGIGLQAHFGPMNLPYVRDSIDVLDSVKLPIWITELDINNKTGPDQANRLDQIMRELHAHHAVQGILMWSAISPEDCWKMCLTDQNFNNLDTGEVVDKFIAEWTYSFGLEGKTDSDGYFETSLFHGQYEATLRFGKEVILQKFEVMPNGEGKDEVVVFKICE